MLESQDNFMIISKKTDEIVLKHIGFALNIQKEKKIIKFDHCKE